MDVSLPSDEERALDAAFPDTMSTETVYRVLRAKIDRLPRRVAVLEDPARLAAEAAAAAASRQKERGSGALAAKYRYATAIWRGVTGTCQSCGHLLLSFEIEDGPDGTRADLIAQLQAGAPIRLRLGPRAVQDLIDVLPQGQSGGGLCSRCATQSAKSSGSPTVDGSSPELGQALCPPTKSSSAARGE